jgi:hypothetical protein
MTRVCALPHDGLRHPNALSGFATQHIWHVIRSIRPNVRYWPFSALRQTFIARVSRYFVDGFPWGRQSILRDSCGLCGCVEPLVATGDYTHGINQIECSTTLVVASGLFRTDPIEIPKHQSLARACYAWLRTDRLCV